MSTTIKIIKITEILYEIILTNGQGLTKEEIIANVYNEESDMKKNGFTRLTMINRHLRSLLNHDFICLENNFYKLTPLLSGAYEAAFDWENKFDPYKYASILAAFHNNIEANLMSMEDLMIIFENSNLSPFDDYIA